MSNQRCVKDAKWVTALTILEHNKNTNKNVYQLPVTFTIKQQVGIYLWHTRPGVYAHPLKIRKVS